ncbi:hypothetical protein BJ166DRAFT_595063 [Pestalotiopsis sp. NC0098]|nr:hypothetical protein BJ166DRAFT_595063 [Pestalotiopsis sp. NC0098]
MMRTLLILTTLVLSVLGDSLFDARAFNQGFCNVHGPIISTFRREPGATAWCSNYLGFGTKTATWTFTVTPTAKHHTHWVTRTGRPTVTTTTITKTRITTVGATVTATTTNSAPIITITNCASEQTTVAIDKRQFHFGSGFGGHQGGSPRRPSHFPPTWGKPSQSAACKCLPITSATTTKTRTKYGPTKTNTVTISSTVTTTVITTSTIGGASTSTTKTIITNVPTGDLTPSGLRFKVFKSPYSDWKTDVPDPSYFKGKTPTFSGTLDDLNFQTAANGLLNLGGRTFNATQVAVLAQGYFYAKHTGSYYIGSTGFSTDDWAFMWTGQKAFHDWDLDNRDGEAFGHRIVNNEDMGVQLNNLDEAQLIPFTYLWINYLGAGQSNFFIDDARNIELTFDNRGWFIWDCDENAFTS